MMAAFFEIEVGAALMALAIFCAAVIAGFAATFFGGGGGAGLAVGFVVVAGAA
jgi:hypothetical protein